MKATIWVQLQVTVEVEGETLLECREKAVAQIDDFTPEQMEEALRRAKSIGRDYPHDVTEWVD